MSLPEFKCAVAPTNSTTSSNAIDCPPEARISRRTTVLDIDTFKVTAISWDGELLHARRLGIHILARIKQHLRISLQVEKPNDLLEKPRPKVPD